MVETAIQCARCDKTNASTKRFCGGCGSSLWEPCLQCGEEIAVGEPFCGSCGAHLSVLARQVAEHANSQIASAQQRAEQFAFADAISLLREVAERNHPRLQEQAQAAERLIQELRLQRDAWDEKDKAACRQAELDLAGENYELVVQQISAIPEPIRSKSCVEILDEARKQIEQTARLESEVRAAMQQKDASAACLLIDQLLARNPDHADARRLAQKLSAHMVKTARQLRADHRYADAIRRLEQIPGRYRSQVERAIDELKELRWLERHLAESPVANRLLGEAARRWVDLDGTHPRAQGLLTKVSEQLKSSSKASLGDSSFSGEWARAPERTQLGPPVDYFGGPRRLELNEACAALWQTSEAQFNVACGLALHGCAQGEITLDLHPPKRQGIAGLLSKRKTPTTSWGLDLGGDGLKAVQLQANGGKLAITDLYYRPYESESSALGDSSLDAALKEFVAKRPDAKDVVINVDGRRVLSRLLQLPPVDDKLWKKTLAYEVRHQVPVPIEELCWSTCVPPDSEDEPHSPGRQTLLVAVRASEIAGLQTLCQECGLNLHGVQPDSIALYNLLAFEDELQRGSSSMFVDIGSHCSQVLVTDRRRIWLRTIAMGSRDVIQALVRDCKLTHKQARQITREPYRARLLSKLFASIDPVHERLSTQLRQSMEAAARELPEVRRIYLLGGGSRMPGLLAHLRSGPSCRL